MTREKTHADAVDYPPSAVAVSCNDNQVEYWTWDSYAKTPSSVGMWIHRCLSGGTVLASESDIVALPTAANATIVGPTAAPLSSIINVPPSGTISGLTTPTESAQPQMSEIVTGWLKKSSTCAGYDPNTMSPPSVWPSSAGCDHGDTQPTFADAKADDTGGSVGVYTIQATARDGVTTVTFTWDISRWAKGDIFAGIQNNFVKVFDRDMNFKRYLALSDSQRHAIPVMAGTPASPTGDAGFWVPAPNSTDSSGAGKRFLASPDGNLYHLVDSLIGTDHLIGRKGPKGCAVNFRTGEVLFANFDYYDPGLNLVGRQPGDTTPGSAHGDLDYSDLSRRFSTERYRQNDNPQRRNVVDASPESIKFDLDMNLYVGHEQPWLAANGDVVDLSSPDDLGAAAPEGHKVWNYDDNVIYRGVWDPAYTGGPQPAVDPELYADTIRIRRTRYGAALPGDPAPGSAYGYWEDISVPYTSPDANPFAWLLDTIGAYIPLPRVIGRGLHRYISPSKQGSDWTRANANNGYFSPFVSRSGVDWIDLAAPQRDGNGNLLPPVVFYTTQSGDIHKFDTATGTQLADWNVSRLFRSELHSMRLLPPGDGTDILVLALDLDNGTPSTRTNSIMRIQLGTNGVATPVQSYVVKDTNGVVLQPQPEWKDMDMSPDGRTFVATAANSSAVYRFDVETGAYVIERAADETGSASRFDSRSVCVMWQYSTQQEICGNGIDDDGDGIIDNACSHIPTNPDALIARNDAYITRQDVALNVGGVGVLVNDGADVTRGSLVAAVIPNDPLNPTGPFHGTVTLSVDGSFLYTPNAGYHGPDSFQYTAANGSVTSNPATVSILVTPLVADDGPFSLVHQCNAAGVCQSLTINGVLANDSSSGMAVTMAGASASLGTAVTAAGVHITSDHGADVHIFADGHFVYTPLAGFAGGLEDHFFYRASDGISEAVNENTALYGTSARFAKVTVVLLNQPPIATPNSYTTPFNTPIDFRYAPCLGVQDVQNGCVPDAAANLANGLLLKNNEGVDSDPDGDAVAIPQYGLGLDSVPSGADPSETWQPSGGKQACAGLSSGFTDAYCHTAQGGRIEVWSDGQFRYYPPVDFSGEDHVYYRVSDGSALSNWAKVTITIDAAVSYPMPVAVSNAYETTSGFNLDVHYPPCIAGPGYIETNASIGCPPSDTNNPNAVHGILRLTDQVVGYVDANHVDARGVQILQTRAADPLPTGTQQTDWADDVSALRVHSWGERQADMPGPLDLETWALPEVGDDVNICRGMAQGTTDAYCPTVGGGLLEIWADGTFRYQPPNIGVPQADWFWYRVTDGHGQLSNWARVTINVRARMEIHANSQTRPYGAAGPSTAGAGYFDFLLDNTYTSTPQSIARPADMAGTLSCTAWDGAAPVSATTPVGVYPITCSGETRSGHEVTYVASTLTITPVPLTVTADDKSKVYGAALPGLTSTITGFVNGETLAVVSGSAQLTTSATASSPVVAGGYPITGSLGTLGAANYTFQFSSGTLTITPALLTVTVDDATKAYGAALPSFTFAISGFVNGDTPGTAVSGTPAITTTATAASSVAAYPASAAQGSLLAPNYTFAFVDGTLTITPVPLAITADDKTKQYDKVLFTAFTAQYSGLVNGDGPTSVGAVSYSGPAVSAINVNTSSGYTIQPNGPASTTNYAPITYSPGTLRIEPAPLDITANSATKLYTLSYSFSGTEFSLGAGQLKAGDSVTSVTLESTGAPAGMPAGNYAIVPSAAQGSGLANYAIQYHNGTLTVFTNRPPIAEEDFGTTKGMLPVTVSVLPNDHDPDEGDVISIVPGSLTQPVATVGGQPTGTAVMNYTTGTVTYTAPALFVGTVTLTYTIQDQLGASDVDPSHVENSVGIVTVTVLPAEVCYVGTQSPQITARQQFWGNVDGTVTVRTWLARNFNDNTYGANQIGWPGLNHTFNMLVTSDMVQVALHDGGGVKKMEFKQDYLSASSGAPSGYASLGVTGGDGAMLLGSAGNVVAATSSMAVNFNNGGIAGDPFDPNYVLTTVSPQTDAAYTADPAYPNWIFDVWYEATVNASVFGAAGFGYPRITSMHASPSKTGTETEPLAVVSCVPPVGAPVGIADYFEVKSGKTMLAADGVLSNDTDPDNDAMTAVLQGQVSKGTLTFNANGTFTYKAPSNFTGVVTFGYRPSDTSGNLGTLIIVSITVKP